MAFLFLSFFCLLSDFKDDFNWLKFYHKHNFSFSFNSLLYSFLEAKLLFTETLILDFDPLPFVFSISHSTYSYTIQYLAHLLIISQ
jgi:hypothetical protein